MPKTRILRVLPNPYSAHDHEGRPSGRLQYEPDLRYGDAGLRYVGARIVATKVRDADPRLGITEDHEHCVHFATEPVSVPCSAYYLVALRHRDLLPADAETHEIVFGSKAGFRDPIERLAQYAAERGCVPEPTEEWTKLLGAAAPEHRESA